MWFIFPQLRGLGRSATADFYGIGCIAEGRGRGKAEERSCLRRR
jgi:uncharacterized protein (DUF1810 family)